MPVQSVPTGPTSDVDATSATSAAFDYIAHEMDRLASLSHELTTRLEALPPLQYPVQSPAHYTGSILHPHQYTQNSSYPYGRPGRNYIKGPK